MKEKYAGMITLVTIMFVFSGCASAVYNYEYGEPGSQYQYPKSVSVQYSPGYIPVYPYSDFKIGAGMDVEYLLIPMGSNIFITNRNIFASLRVGNQWSTIDNEVIGAEIQIGTNYFVNKTSILSLAVSYTNLDLTTRDVIRGNITGGTIRLSKVIFRKDKPYFMLEPMFASLYFSNNVKRFNFTATVEHHVTDSVGGYTVRLEHPSFDRYLWSFGLGLDTRFESFTWYVELGKVFPKRMFDKNGRYSIRYDYYLTSGLFLNF